MSNSQDDTEVLVMIARGDTRLGAAVANLFFQSFVLELSLSSMSILRQAATTRVTLLYPLPHHQHLTFNLGR